MEPEIQGYLTEFGIIRRDIRDAIKALNDEGANWHPLQKETNSIYAILTHLMGADDFWVHDVIIGEKKPRDREAEFRAKGNLKELLTRRESAWSEIESILTKLSHEQLLEVRSFISWSGHKESVTVQWIILHLISHNATHLGHIQLTCQLWEQRK
jgi:uncharacterized damage-inducible protein DinB